MTSNEKSGKSLFACAREALLTADAFEKAHKTAQFVQDWKSGVISCIVSSQDDTTDIPSAPARPDNITVVPMSKVKQGSRKAFVHRFVHARISMLCDQNCMSK